MAGDLFALRIRLGKGSAKLLDDCEHYMRQAGLLDLLMERIELITTIGLNDQEIVQIQGVPVRVCVLKPFAELMLREWLDVAKRDWSVARKQQAVMDIARFAGFEP